VLEAFRKHAQSEGLCLCHGLFCGRAIRENTGQLGYFGEPAPVFFLFVFNGEMHSDSFYAPSPPLATGVTFGPAWLIRNA
jgi:hypothetical protein